MRARYYDPTIGRFLSEDRYQGVATDPLSLNLYTYCQNNPIMYYDQSGHVIELSSDATKEQKQQYKSAIAYLSTSETGKALIDKLESSSEVITIVFTDDCTARYSWDTRTLFWDPTNGHLLSDGVSIQSASLTLAHEMGHGAQHLYGALDAVMKASQAERLDLVPIVETENLKLYESPIVKELGEPTRNTYDDSTTRYRMSNSTNWGVVSYVAKSGYINKNPWGHKSTIPWWRSPFPYK